MKYVTCYGGLWRLTNKQYKAMLTDIMAGPGIDLDHYGKNIGIIEVDVTDLTSEEARGYLQE